jgi:hypothetical protein
MRQHAEQSDVPLPAALPLMQRRLADNFVSVQHQQRQVAFEIRVAAPFAEHGALKDGLFDEQTFLLGHGEKKFMKPGFVPFVERAHDDRRAVAQFQGDGKFFERKFDHNKPFIPPFL